MKTLSQKNQKKAAEIRAMIKNLAKSKKTIEGNIQHLENKLKLIEGERCQS